MTSHRRTRPQARYGVDGPAQVAVLVGATGSLAVGAAAALVARRRFGRLLLAVARSLATGQATGLDIWQGNDQSGNTEAATRRNANAEGLTDRIDLVTGDMRALHADEYAATLVGPAPRTSRSGPWDGEFGTAGRGSTFRW